MLSTIQPIGNRPVKPPSTAAWPAIVEGIPYTKIAMTSALSNPKPAATCALMCRKPRHTSITTTGTAARIVDNTMLPRGS